MAGSLLLLGLLALAAGVSGLVFPAAPVLAADPARGEPRPKLPLTLSFRPGAVQQMHYESYAGGKRLLRITAEEVRLARKKVGVLRTALLRQLDLKNVTVSILQEGAEREYIAPKGVLELKSGELTLYCPQGRVVLPLRKLALDPSALLH